LIERKKATTPEILLGYGIYKNQQIPHEIKENPSF
jgi:hypothetical protein